MTVRAPRSGWWVVGGGAALLTVQNGLIMAAFGTYLVEVTGDTGWAVGVLALGYAIVQLGNGFVAPLTGWCCDRVGTRAVAACGSGLAATGFVLAAFAGSETQFLGAVVVIALGCSACGIMPLTVAVVQALPERRTLALGLLPSGVALGGLAVPLVVLALETFGWRTTFLLVAAVLGGIGLAAGSVLPTRPPPEEQRPPPCVAAEPAVAPVPAAPGPNGAGHSLRAAMHTPAFWLLVAGHGSALVAISAVNLHLVPLLTRHHGLSLTLAGLAMAAMSLAQLVGQVAIGVLGDRLDSRVVAAGAMAVQAMVLVALATVSAPAALLGAAVVHGLAWGLRGPVMTTLRADYFGLASFGVIMGWSMGFVSLGLVAGPLLVTAVEAGPGGYPAAMLALAAVTGAGTVAFRLLPRPPVGGGGRGGARGIGDAIVTTGRTVMTDDDTGPTGSGGDGVLSRPRTYVFDGATSARGYPMNTMLMTFRSAAARAEFGADEGGYCDRFGLAPEQRRAVLDRDWEAMLELGGSIFYVYKLAMMDGVSMQGLGGVFTGLGEAEFTAQLRAGGRSDG